MGIRTTSLAPSTLGTSECPTPLLRGHVLPMAGNRLQELEYDETWSAQMGRIWTMPYPVQPPSKRMRGNLNSARKRLLFRPLQTAEESELTPFATPLALLARVARRARARIELEPIEEDDSVPDELDADKQDSEALLPLANQIAISASMPSLAFCPSRLSIDQVPGSKSNDILAGSGNSLLSCAALPLDSVATRRRIRGSQRSRRVKHARMTLLECTKNDVQASPPSRFLASADHTIAEEHETFPTPSMAHSPRLQPQSLASSLQEGAFSSFPA
jgi:hypothetical protein